ncbi:MAG TPA: NADH-quinone oxidoreductase subunit J [Pirellulaceae bacterium]|nr:NADH-quinone oxidoreductase subunit J [Pirellulaceae bacterium]
MTLLLAAIHWHSVTFLFFALVACAFAVAVVATSNVVRMAFYLTLSLGATSGLFFLAGAPFVGAMQLMIYVGGTLVLLIFGVMLTAQARFISMKTSGGEWVMAAVLGASLLGLLVATGFSIESWRKPRADLAAVTLADGQTSTPIGMALTGVRVDKLSEPSAARRHGMSGYLFPFVIISMHLLVVLIGAGYMARTKRVGSRMALERAAPATPRIRRRSFAVAGGLISGIVVNLALAIACFAWWLRPPAAAASGNSLLGQIQILLEPASGWLWPVLGGLFAANVLLLVIVYLWQSWAVIGLVAIPLAQAAAIANAGLGNVPAVAFALLALAPVVLLIVLMCSGPRPTMWEQMD